MNFNCRQWCLKTILPRGNEERREVHVPMDRRDDVWLMVLKTCFSVSAPGILISIVMNNIATVNLI